MKSIKKISGDLLLYFYALQRKNAFPIMEVLGFTGINDKIQIEDNSELTKGILNITNDSTEDAFNALRYLEKDGFISYKEERDSGGYYFHHIELNPKGIDIVEGIERDEIGKKEFHVNFNIKLADNINIDSLIKAELGSLIKNSLI